MDGTDFVASHRAMREAVAYVRARKGPVLVHAKVVRPYSHSLSDDEKLYKTPLEREAEARRDPIKQLLEALVQAGVAADSELARIISDIEREVDDARADRAAGGAAGERHGGAVRPLARR